MVSERGLLLLQREPHAAGTSAYASSTSSSSFSSLPATIVLPTDVAFRRRRQASTATLRAAVQLPPELLKQDRVEKQKPEYGGGIEYRSLLVSSSQQRRRHRKGSSSFARTIPDDADETQEEQRRSFLELCDKTKRGSEYVSGKKEPDRFEHYEELDYPKGTGCYKPKWSYQLFPNCNTFHELSLGRPVMTADDNGSEGSTDNFLQSMNVEYLGRGHFREGWLVADASERFDFVLKTIRFWEKETVTPYGVAQTQAEAVTMLQTSDSNRTTSIYGHCSTSIMVERGIPFRRGIIDNWYYHDQAKLDEEQVDGVKPANDYTPEEKLNMILAMAESLADMHGNPGGAIVNHDISLDQWLMGKDGVIKLNDFNKAKTLQWNPQEEKYCKFWSHQKLLYYAPEDIEGALVDESSDVHTFGKIMYIILVGMKPYYHKMTDEAAYKAILDGEFPYVDPRYTTERSLIERRLVELMERTWALAPEERPSIFQVVEHLRETARLGAAAAAAAANATAPVSSKQ